MTLILTSRSFPFVKNGDGGGGDGGGGGHDGGGGDDGGGGGGRGGGGQEVLAWAGATLCGTPV